METRRFPLYDFECRQDDDGNMELEGYFYRWGDTYKTRYFKELFDKGAFDSSLKSDTRVFMFHSHDAANVISSTPDNMKLSKDGKGVKLLAKLNASQISRDVYEMVDAGDIDGLSAGFRILSEDPQTPDVEDTDQRTTYVIKDIDLREVSTTPIPAYTKTNVDARDDYFLSNETRDRRGIAEEREQAEEQAPKIDAERTRRFWDMRLKSVRNL